MIDLFEADGFMKSNVEIRITLDRSEPNFYLVLGDETKNNSYRFQINKIGLYVPIVRINDAIIPMLNRLCDKAPARYCYDFLVCKKYNLPKETLSFEYQKVFQNHVPQRLVLAIHKHQAVSGSKLLNPFFTSSDINIREIRLECNGNVIRTIKPRFASADYGLSYRSFIEFMGVTDHRYPITYGDYPNGLRLVLFIYFYLHSCCIDTLNI